MTRTIDALLTALRAEEARGVEHVDLDEGAKEILRQWFVQTRQVKKGGLKRSAAVRSEENPATHARMEVSIEDEPASLPVRSEVRAEGDDASEKIASLKRKALEWAPAKALRSLRDTMVFSTGNPSADLMLVGEAPGYHEERQQEPFVGPAGQKLNDILKAMGLARESVYITNIVKFRPSMPQQTTNNRKPTAEEMEVCLPFIREEVKVVQPRCIVALGATAAEGLLALSGSVGRMRGRWHDFEGIPARVTYHPAYLLHGSAGLKDKRMIWEDMLEVMEKLSLPIGDKQRGYFLPKK
ncbi:MAG: uracil-DNA glycosylase [Verrucomicrobiales bacterium]